MANGLKTEPRLVEVTSLPVIYADGAAKITIEGSNARITYFEYRTIGTERIKMPVLEMVRPMTSCGKGSLATLIKMAAGVDGTDTAH